MTYRVGLPFARRVMWTKDDERIGFRIAEYTMPRNSDTADKYYSLGDAEYDIIIDWRQSN